MTAVEGERLLPCPFCGSPGQWHEGTVAGWIVACANTDFACNVRPATWWGSRADAVLHWNRRPVATERDAVLEEAARVCDDEERRGGSRLDVAGAGYAERCAERIRALKTNHRPKGGDGVGR